MKDRKGSLSEAQKTLKAARRFIRGEFDGLLGSVCSTGDDGKPDMQQIDPYSVPDVRAYQRILRKLDKAITPAGRAALREGTE